LLNSLSWRFVNVNLCLNLQRNIRKDGTATKKRKGQPWSIKWNDAQANSSNPKTVIYGHAAARGLTLRQYSFGIDSACVKGGHLTALIWNENKKIVTIPCAKYKTTAQ
jgi:hypothetical protein